MVEVNSRSESLFKRALEITPGGVHSPVRNLRHVGIDPIFFSYGDGANLFDVDGKAYIDFCMSFGPHILGHCPDVVVRALREQVSKALSLGACHPGEVDLVEKILDAYPFLGKVRLVNSGTEAVMTAVRIARAYTGKEKILKFEGCYHGHSDGLLAKAGSGVAHLSEATSSGVGSAQVKDTLTADFNDLDGLEKLLSENRGEIAAVLLEPIPANNGLHVPSRAHLQEIVTLAKKAGALVVFDEVISGFRVGPQGACGHFDLQPDIVTLGKIIGGGLPLAAVVGTGPIMDTLAPIGSAYQAGTLSGNPLATAAGCAVLEALKSEPPYEKLKTLTEAFTDKLAKKLAPLEPLHISQLGSIFWLYFGPAPKEFPAPMSESARAKYADFFKKALAAGIYLPPSPYEVGFVSTAHTEAILDLAVEKSGQCVGS